MFAALFKTETSSSAFALAIQQYGQELMDSDNVVMKPNVLTTEFKPSSSKPMTSFTQQVIFQNAFENEFYTSLMSSRQDSKFVLPLFQIVKQLLSKHC